MFADFKKIIKHTVIYGAGTVVGKAVGFIMVPVYTRFLSPTDYGVIELLTLTSFVIAWIIGMGLSSSVLRFYYEYQNEEERNEVVATGLVALIGISLTGVVCLTFFSERLSFLFFGVENYSLFLRMTFLTTFFELLIGIPLTYLRIKEMPFFFTVLTIIRLVMALSLNIVLIVNLKMGIMGVFLSSLITNALLGTSMIIYTFKKVKIKFSCKKFIDMLHYGVPLIPAGLSLFVLTFSDRYFLQHYRGLQEVGVYALAYKFASMLGVLISEPFGQIWGAFRFSIINNYNANDIYSRVLTYFFYVIVFAGLGLAVFSKEIILISTAESFSNAAGIIPVIILAYIVSSFSGILDFGLHYKKKTVCVAAVLITAAIVNIYLNYLLIPRFGMLGAAFATVVSYAYSAVCTFFLSQIFYRITYQFDRIFQMLTLGVMIYFLSQAIMFNSFVGTILMKLLLVIMFPFSLYLLRFYTKDEIQRINVVFRRVFLRN